MQGLDIDLLSCLYFDEPIVGRVMAPAMAAASIMSFLFDFT